MAKDNRVCIPKDLIDPVKAEAEKLLLTDDPDLCCDLDFKGLLSREKFTVLSA